MRQPGTRYSARVLELFRTLPFAGTLSAAPDGIASAEAIALDRGAWVKFEARVDAGRIVACRFRAWGCPHTLAAAALAAGWLEGWPIGEATRCEAVRLARELEAPAEKMGRLLVVEDAARALLAEAAQVQ
jgi:NifU-like protein involved in Fe-S cluster formation